MLIQAKEKVGVKKLKNLREIIEYSQIIDDVYENLEDYNPTTKTKKLVDFDDIMIWDMEANKRLSPIVKKHSYRLNFNP